MAAVPSIAPVGIERDAQALYERHHASVLRFCRSKLRSREDAEDAAQTTFAHALRGLGRGVVPECEQAWLLTIARNVCCNRWDAARRRSGVEVDRDPQVLQEIAPAHEDVSADLIGLEDALAGLTEHQRRAILLREWKGLSYAEIAVELEVAESAVETLLFRARRSLARRLRDVGSILSGLKSLLGGGAVVAKVAAGVLVVAGAGAIAAPQVARRDVPSVPALHASQGVVQAPTAPHTVARPRTARPRPGAASVRRAPARRAPSVSTVTPVDASPRAPSVSPVDASPRAPAPVATPKAETRAEAPTAAPQPAPDRPAAAAPPLAPPVLPSVPKVETPAISVPNVPAADVPPLPAVPALPDPPALPTVTVPAAPPVVKLP